MFSLGSPDSTSCHYVFHGRKSTSVQLTEKEFYLLKYFFENKDIILSKDELLRKVWNINTDDIQSMSDSRVLETLVSKIRKKLNIIKNGPKIVKFKEGYKILI